MLGHLYYFFGLLIFLSNLLIQKNILNLIKLREWTVKFHKVSGRQPLKSDFKDKEYEQFILANFIWLMTFFWLFFGLLTKSWLVFVVIIFYNFLTTFISKKIGQFSIISKSLEVFRVFVNTTIIGFLIVNHFHLHMDIIQFLLK